MLDTTLVMNLTLLPDLGLHYLRNVGEIMLGFSFFHLCDLRLISSSGGKLTRLLYNAQLQVQINEVRVKSAPSTNICVYLCVCLQDFLNRHQSASW